MAYDISLSAHHDYLRFEASGKRTLEGSEDLGRYAAKVSAERDIYNVLFVLKLPGRLATFELQDLVSRFREFGFGSRHRVAVVDENEDSRPDQDFIEDVVRARGLNSAAFDTESEALRWLLGAE